MGVGAGLYMCDVVKKVHVRYLISWWVLVLFGYAIGPFSVLSVCDIGVLRPNGWMDEDETWHGGRPRPWPHCVGPCLFWPNGWMDQDATWYEDRPWPWPPIFGTCVLWPNGWMDQDVTWYEEAGLARPRHVTLCSMGTPLRPPPGSKKGHNLPRIFGPYLLWPNRRPSQLLLRTCVSCCLN